MLIKCCSSNHRVQIWVPKKTTYYVQSIHFNNDYKVMNNLFIRTPGINFSRTSFLPGNVLLNQQTVVAGEGKRICWKPPQLCDKQLVIALPGQDLIFCNVQYWLCCSTRPVIVYCLRQRYIVTRDNNAFDIVKGSDISRENIVSAKCFHPKSKITRFYIYCGPCFVKFTIYKYTIHFQQNIHFMYLS